MVLQENIDLENNQAKSETKVWEKAKPLKKTKQQISNNNSTKLTKKTKPTNTKKEQGREKHKTHQFPNQN